MAEKAGRSSKENSSIDDSGADNSVGYRNDGNTSDDSDGIDVDNGLKNDDNDDDGVRNDDNAGNKLNFVHMISFCFSFFRPKLKKVFFLGFLETELTSEDTDTESSAGANNSFAFQSSSRKI